MKVTGEFLGANILAVSVETNTPKGGDGGHGGLTIVSFKDLAGTGWDLFVDDKKIEQPHEITIHLYGDSEAQTIADALIFAGETLKQRMKINALAS